MMELFETTKQNISLHTRNLFGEGELEEAAVVKESLTTALDGKKREQSGTIWDRPRFPEVID